MKMNKYGPRTPPGNLYNLRDMLCTFADLLWTLFGYMCSLYIQLFRLWEILDTEEVIENRSKFTPLCSEQVTWQVLEETRFFFVQRFGPDDFVNGGPQRFPMAELTVLIDDVRHNKPLDSVTIPGRWNFKHDGKFGYTDQGGTNTWKGKQCYGSNIQTNARKFGGEFRGAATTQRGPDPYITTSGVTPQLHTS